MSSPVAANTMHRRKDLVCKKDGSGALPSSPERRELRIVHDPNSKTGCTTGAAPWDLQEGSQRLKPASGTVLGAKKRLDVSDPRMSALGWRWGEPSARLRPQPQDPPGRPRRKGREERKARPHVRRWAASRAPATH